MSAGGCRAPPWRGSAVVPLSKTPMMESLATGLPDCGIRRRVAGAALPEPVPAGAPALHRSPGADHRRLLRMVAAPARLAHTPGTAADWPRPVARKRGCLAEHAALRVRPGSTWSATRCGVVLARAAAGLQPPPSRFDRHPPPRWSPAYRRHPGGRCTWLAPHGVGSSPEAGWPAGAWFGRPAASCSLHRVARLACGWLVLALRRQLVRSRRFTRRGHWRSALLGCRPGSRCPVPSPLEEGVCTAGGTRLPPVGGSQRLVAGRQQRQAAAARAHRAPLMLLPGRRLPDAIARQLLRSVAAIYGTCAAAGNS